MQFGGKQIIANNSLGNCCLRELKNNINLTLAILKWL